MSKSERQQIAFGSFQVHQVNYSKLRRVSESDDAQKTDMYYYGQITINQYWKNLQYDSNYNKFFTVIISNTGNRENSNREINGLACNH